ncbi:MAG: hypothetical protein Q8R30_01000 [bacterium]|nr:hypothetical protein [bacterium]
MNKYRLLCAGALCAVCVLYVLAGAVQAQYEDADRGVPFISVNAYTLSMVKNSFTGSGSAMDAYLYRIQVHHFPAYGKEEKGGDLSIKSIGFELTHFSDITPSSAGEMRLVRDMNRNEKPDADDKVMARSMIDFAQGIIFFKFDEPIAFESGAIFFLAGDFPVLVAHAELRVKLSDRLVVVEDREDGKNVRVVVAASTETWHHEGNSAPTLSYSNRLEENKFGVMPSSGRSGDMFMFEAIYTDRDGDIAQRVEVWIDLNENRKFDDGERFEMKIPDPPVVAANQRYRFSMRIIAAHTGRIMYRFFASDGKDDAVGGAAEPAYLKINTAFVIANARVLSDSVVPGEKFDVAYTVRYFFESVKVKWDSVRGMDVAPFVFLGTVHKNRRPLDLVYDEEVFIVSFQSPKDLHEGNTRVPVIGLQAQWYDFTNQTEKSIEAFGPDVQVSVVPLRAWVEVKPSRAAMTIADEIRVVLNVIKRTDIELISDPESEFTFPLSDEHARFVLSRDRNVHVDKLTYTAVFHSTAAVGVTPRKRVITPLYKLEYRVFGYDVLYSLVLPEQSLTFMPILTTQEASSQALVFPRLVIPPEFRFGTQGVERVVARAMYAFGALGLGAIVIPLVVFLWSAMFGGLWYRKTAARRSWRSHVRSMRRVGVHVSHDLLVSCEQSFRRHLAYVCGCSEKEAQSVALWEIVEKSCKFSFIVRGSIRASLDRFRALAEGRGQEHDAVDLIFAQHRLRKSM